MYIIKPKNVRAADIKGSLEKIAKEVYANFVGSSFDEKVLKPGKNSKVNVPANIPPAWLLENVTRQKMGQALNA